MKFIIMAGGLGTKLWPVSREDAPKQFYPLIGKKTLFQLNVEALLERYSPYDIYVSTTEKLLHFVREQAPQIPGENYIIEPPEGRDTGPASGFAMLKLYQKFPDEVVMFYVQSPIVRNPTDKYLDMVESMEKLVKKYGQLVTGTQIPRYLETGSDLLKLGANVPSTNGIVVHQVSDFIDVVKDRMTLEQVTEIASQDKVGTHCNHNTWTPAKLLDAIKEFRPDWYSVLMKIQEVLGTPEEEEKVKRLYEQFEPGRIELVTKQLMKRGEVQAVIVPYKWTHITTWDDVARYYLEEAIETHQTEVIEVESKDNLVLSDTKKLIALVGIKDTVVVETPDSILVVPKEMANKVKEVHDILKTRGYEDFL